MPIICRLLGLEADAATELSQDHNTLQNHVLRCDIHTEVYWFWHAIDHLLAEVEAPPASHCLRSGGIELPNETGVPANRLHLNAPLQKIAAALKEVAPEALFAGYDAPTMDAAHIYPERWVELDEEHDVIGDLLEHYHFLREFAVERASQGHAMLVLYERREDETGF